MTQYISKSALVAEIERRISVLKANESVISMLAGGMFVNEFKDLLSFLDTLEVKEVVRINTSLSDIDDDLKKLGVDPDSKQAKMLKDCYYRAIDRILEKGEKV